MSLPDGLEKTGLRKGSRIYEYLIGQMLPGTDHERPDLEIQSLNWDNSIFLLTEPQSQSRIVCKFFSGRPSVPESECRNLLDHEFHSLMSLRFRGFDRFPFYVVKPLAKVKELGCLLAEEFIPGVSMDYFISEAVHRRKWNQLMKKLELLAGFFAHLHETTSGGQPENFTRVTVFFRNLVQSLAESGVINSVEAVKLNRRCDKWEAMQEMWSAPTCLVHGDATPTNFIFDSEGSLTAIDLERLHVNDPIYDVGLFVAELKHHFALRILDAEASEPFISCFLRQYSASSSMKSSFEEMTYRNRFFMALGELRIARNPWLPIGHRTWLAREAQRCLDE